MPQILAQSNTAPEPNPDASRSMARAWWGVAILFVIQMFSFVDRQALSLLIAPIKTDLGMTDTAVSLVVGLGFAFAYAIAGLPIGRLVDRVSRPLLLTGGLVLWSLCTFLCGFVRSFPQLALARSGVGIGEATATPVVVSLLADYFPPGRRGIAFAAFAVSAYVGTGLSLLVGGATVHAFEGMAYVDLPWLGAVRPWHVVFLILGPCGLAAVPLALALHEPRRRQRPAPAVRIPISGSAVPPVREVIAHYRRHWRAFLTQHAASTLLAMLFYGTSAWIPEFLRRTYGLSIANAGFAFGLVTMVAGSTGVLAGGWVSDAMVRRGQSDARLRTLLYAALAALPFAITFPLAGTAALSLVLVALMVFFTATVSTAGSTGLQELAPPRMRGTASAVYLFIFNGVGLSLGPTAIALLTDRLFGDPAQLWHALSYAAPAMAALAALCAGAGLPAYRRCVSATAQADRAPPASPGLACCPAT